MAWVTALRNRSFSQSLPRSVRTLFGSLAGRLTLAFLLVGVLGVLLFALLIGQRTRTEFDRFLSNRDQSILIDALNDYYAATGDWSGVRQVLRAPPLDFFARDILLLDANRVVQLGNRNFDVGDHVPANAMREYIALTHDGETVGYVMWLAPQGGRGGPNVMGRGAGMQMQPVPLEDDFWQRIMWAAIASGIITVLLALLLGWLLARTLTAPVRELTAATQAMAAGNLDQRVEVKSHDEIGNLALAFNQMSADLARASQLRKQMTADLAHDLRTPLTVLRGYLEGLKDAQLQGTSSLYTLMHEEVLHLQRLVEDLRVLSLADAGELSLNRRQVDPIALLERTGLAYFVAAEQQGVQLRVETGNQNAKNIASPNDTATDEAEQTLPSILVDTDRITQVLNNLVSNALRHTTHGEIVLRAWAENGTVRMSVSDTGSGIAAEDLPFVFDRFYRGDKSRHRTGTGDSSGLGLAIAKAIVEAHDGTLQVESVEGRGTTFTLVMPVAERSRTL